MLLEVLSLEHLSHVLKPSLRRVGLMFPLVTQNDGYDMSVREASFLRVAAYRSGCCGAQDAPPSQVDGGADDRE